MTAKEKPPVAVTTQGAEGATRCTSDPSPELDSGQAINNALFLAALFHPGDTCWTTRFRENPGDASGACWGGQSCQPEQAVDAPEMNAYFSVASFKAGSSKRAYANFAHLSVLVLDDVQDCPLDPTWRLRTSPGKVQVGYRLSEPVGDLGIAKRLHERLAQAGHIPLDRNGNNPVRYVRLPVGVNSKHDPPYSCRLEVFQPDTSYSLSELIAGLALDAAYILHGPAKAAPSATFGGTIPEGARNASLTSLAGTMRRRGMGQESIVAALLIENASRCLPPLPERDVTTIARSITQYHPADVPGDPRPSVFLGPERGRCSALLSMPEEHEFIVEGVLPVCNGVMVAPGGVGKTTLTIYEAICLALGRDVYKRKVLRPGATLFVTGEDERKDYEYRLYWLMKAMNLTPTQRKIVTASIFFEDVSDRIVRLAELDASGNIVMTSHVDELCRLYAGEGLAMVNIDPLVYFSPGERLVNDAEAAMCQVAKRLSRELGAHVRLIHHTGKIVAREAITDQYAGRGGSSLADGSRQFMQIAVGPNKEWLVPAAADPLVVQGYEALRIHFHKVSYAEKPKVPVWLLRSGWGFKEFNGTKSDECLTQQRDMARLCGYLAGKLREGIHYSSSSLEEAKESLDLTIRRLRQLVNEGLQHGELILLDLPTELKRGSFQQYLAPAPQKTSGDQ
ncbi:AAA family ATPase [Pseudomonas sp. R5(2019)]|uniref:AAA family ATPase n=1 Tax=Pseudomonas sp. R5(2019) TaxID=2697566 RepID=UPI001412C683|nr:AAA family ATPase [Pseudomonas sp. R5(2019)]NBA93448.1 AAA family ATPase [Pseudomonas sp. R5(2019)]